MVLIAKYKYSISMVKPLLTVNSDSIHSDEFYYIYGEVNCWYYGSKFCNHKTNDLTPQMTIFSAVIPILIHFFTFLSFKVHYISLWKNHLIYSRDYARGRRERRNRFRPADVTFFSSESDNNVALIFRKIRCFNIHFNIHTCHQLVFDRGRSATRYPSGLHKKIDTW